MEFTGIVKSNIHLSDSDSSNSTKLTQLPTESSGSESNNEQEVQEPRRERPQIEDYVAINNDRDLGPTEDDETDHLGSQQPDDISMESSSGGSSPDYDWMDRTTDEDDETKETPPKRSQRKRKRRETSREASLEKDSSDESCTHSQSSSDSRSQSSSDSSDEDLPSSK